MNPQISDVECRIKDRLAQLVGPQRYKVWFRNATRLLVADGFLKVGVPNLFIGSWIENHFAIDIARAARDVVGRDLQVCYSIDPILSRQLRKTQLDSQADFVQRAAERRLRAGRNGNGDSFRCDARPALRGRLDQFVVGPSNELAFTVARSVTERPGAAYNPVFLHGGCGLGKTHLLQGVANALAAAHPDLCWRYVSGEEFTNEFLLALKLGKLDAFRHRYRDLDALLIDDVHFLSNKRATQDEFLHTFNAINAVGKQVVLASDAHPRMIGQLSEPLVSRFAAGVVIKIEPPDLATRCEILRRRAALTGRPIPDDVLAYVAERIRTNVRELEGALLKLLAFATLARTEITMATAHQALDEHLTRTAPLLTVGDIELAVATFFGLTPADLHSSRKSRTVALARNVAMHLARKHTHLSLPEIGRLMGNKNHTTVLLAHRRINAMLASDATALWNGAAGAHSLGIRELIGRIEDQIRR